MFHPGNQKTPVLTLTLFCLGVLLMLTVCPAVADQTSVDKQYKQARAYYHNLLKDKESPETRPKWLSGIKSFRKIYQANSDHELAPSCLFMIAIMYQRVYQIAGNPLDLGEAISNFEDVAAFYPRHRLADDALFALGQIQQIEKKDLNRASAIFAKIVALYSEGDMAAGAEKQLRALKETRLADTPPASMADMAKLVTVRFGSTNYYTRVVIETSRQVPFEDRILPQNENHPRRLYVNLFNCRIPKELTEPIPIEDGLLQQVRSAQFSRDTVRVVLDTQSFSDYKITTEENPSRIIIDVWGQSQGLGNAAAGQKRKMPSLPQQLGLNAKRIVIDPGHGGKDPGAIAPDGLMEKDIVLAVAKQVAQILHRDLACEVILTRDKDEYLSLEERTEIANAHGGDLFISLHVNSAPNRKARGVETYFLSMATSSEEMQAATLENASSTRQLSDLQAILQDLIQNTKVQESAKLAEYVQDNLVSGLNKKYEQVNNLGVKKAPFIVLIGAQMPAVLTEIAFLSNPEEARRLKTDGYLSTVADQIVAGISQYIQELNVASLR